MTRREEEIAAGRGAWFRATAYAAMELTQSKETEYRLQAGKWLPAAAGQDRGVGLLAVTVEGIPSGHIEFSEEQLADYAEPTVAERREMVAIARECWRELLADGGRTVKAYGRNPGLE